VKELLTEVIENRSLILRRFGQGIFFVACLGIAIACLYLDLELANRLLIGFSIMAICVLILFWADYRVMVTHYGFSFFPPGTGTLRRLTDSGSSRFMSLSEYKTRFYWKNEGIFIGRPVPEQRPLGLFRRCWVGYHDDRHMLTVAPNRSGKGTGALIPNLLLYKGSALVIDPKGELARITAARRGNGSSRIRDAMHQKVFILDLLVRPEDCYLAAGRPLLPEGCTPARWNPLSEFSPDDPDAVAKVQGIVFAMIPDNPSAHDVFYINQSRGLLTALILHVLSTEEEENRNLIRVRRLLALGDQELFDSTDKICERQNKEMPYTTAHDALFDYMKGNESYSGKIAGYARQLLSMPDDTRANVISDLYGRTNFLDLSKTEYMLQGSDFRLSDLKRSPMTLYICAQGTRLGAELKPIVTILLDLAVKAMEATPIKPKEPVLFIMDEFNALGRQDSIDTAMGLIAGFGIKLWPVVQSIDQLKTHYPTSWDNFRVNCAAIQYMGDQNESVIKELENRIGHTVKVNAQGQTERRPLIDGNHLVSGYMNRKKRRQIVLFAQNPAAPLELCDYYRYRWLNKYAELP
jgi:type IV secretion system protein VirD4